MFLSISTDLFISQSNKKINIYNYSKNIKLQNICMTFILENYSYSIKNFSKILICGQITLFKQILI